MNTKLPDLIVSAARAFMVASVIVTGIAVPVAEALGQPCARADFEAVVGTASNTLRDMTTQNTPPFQEKLRELKDKRGWSYEQFVTQAAPLVADEQIAAFDAKSIDYLTRINTLGGEAAGDNPPDCKLLDTVRANLSDLISTQQQKWAYMFGRLDGELAK